MPRGPDGRPFVTPRMPGFDGEELGFSFFGRGGEGEDYSGLTLPRTFFGHSTFTRVSFADADLSESRMCWNDFLECDFSGADLSGCDMRASRFEACSFAGASLRGADLRRSSFVDCEFAGADLAGAVAEDGDAVGCARDCLSEEQQAAMVWAPDPGEEPPGG